MSPRAPGSNSALHRREKKALERRDEAIQRNVDEGMSLEDATKRVDVEMRDNPRGDWRAG